MNEPKEQEKLTLALDPVALLGHLHKAIAEGKKSVNLILPKNEKENEEDADYINEFAFAWTQ